MENLKRKRQALGLVKKGEIRLLNQFVNIAIGKVIKFNHCINSTLNENQSLEFAYLAFDAVKSNEGQRIGL
jgi:hypothetical protein